MENERPLSNALRDVNGLAAGTMAVLTREDRYDVVEPIQHTWLAWALDQEERGRVWHRWQDVWHAWIEEANP